MITLANLQDELLAADDLNQEGIENCQDRCNEAIELLTANSERELESYSSTRPQQVVEVVEVADDK